MNKIIIIVLSFLLVSCAASGPKYQPKILTSADNALIYIYRPSKAVNCCVAPKIYLDNSPKADLKNGGYVAYEVSSGKHEVVVGDGTYGFTPEKVSLNLAAGEKVYLKWVIGGLTNLDLLAVGNIVVGSSTRDYHLIKFPVEKAEAEISELKLSE